MNQSEVEYGYIEPWFIQWALVIRRYWSLGQSEAYAKEVIIYFRHIECYVILFSPKPSA